jgi:hypothetical protein
MSGINSTGRVPDRQSGSAGSNPVSRSTINAGSPSGLRRMPHKHVITSSNLVPATILVLVKQNILWSTLFQSQQAYPNIHHMWSPRFETLKVRYFGLQ